MKKILLTLVLVIVCIFNAEAKDDRLWKVAQNDARKVEKAVGLNKKQYKQIADFQYEKYEALERIKNDSSLTEQQKKQERNKIHQQYSKNAKSIMTAEQLETFLKWRAEVNEKQKKGK